MVKEVLAISVPLDCDLCAVLIRDEFYDVNTPMGWANICPNCFRRMAGVRLGMGLGQRYKKQPDETFKKVEG